MDCPRWRTCRSLSGVCHLSAVAWHQPHCAKELTSHKYAARRCITLFFLQRVSGGDAVGSDLGHVARAQRPKLQRALGAVGI